MRSILTLACCWVLTLAQGAEWPGSEWTTAEPGDVGLTEAELQKARAYALESGGSGMVVRHGRVVMRWGDPEQTYDLKSTSKSIGVTLLGIALKDGKVLLDAPAVQFQPALGVPPAENQKTGWLPSITLRQLANQTAGFEKPGGYAKLLFKPGTHWFYSDAGPNWLAECLTLAYQRDLQEVLFERVFTPLGIKREEIRWRNHAYRPHEIQGIQRREFGSGFHANVNAMARIGYLYLREGRWKDQQIIPAEFVRLCSRPAPELRGLPEYDSTHDNASEHYSLLWWNNGDGTLTGVPKDAYWSWGLYDSIILVIPSLDLVAVRTGKSWPRAQGDHYTVLKPFFEPLAQSAIRQNPNGAAARPPYPPSQAVKRIRWAPADSIQRQAVGSDNWPLTWGEDDVLYTAYGDGRGFEPFVPQKLSLGFARVTGTATSFQGVNIRSAQGERTGDGPSGPKASGLLMVKGVLYLLARNLDNAQLAWSTNKGVQWNWAPWKFSTSFGCPSFVNFGPDYSGSRDHYVYIVSPDGPSAYDPADRMVLARVPADRIREQAAYEFFAQVDAQGSPVWTGDINKRGGIFENVRSCYRGQMTYSPGLKRYLWCQVLPQSPHSQGPRFQGGFGIYDAPEPWGPWTTVFYTPEWDVGPGETSSLPPKWMSSDGKTVHLVFSGNDCFSVRRGELVVAE